MTSAPVTFVDVVFPASLGTPLTYRVPEAWRDAATPGKRVAAPLGRRTVTGYLVGTRERAPVQDIKELGEILDPEPLLDAHLLELSRWVAEYYLCPWGEVIRTALPPGYASAHIFPAARGAPHLPSGEGTPYPCPRAPRDPRSSPARRRPPRRRSADRCSD